jgi:hypothetical protein
MQNQLAIFSRESLEGDGRSGKQDGPAAGVRNSDLGARDELIADAAGKSSAGVNEGTAAPGAEQPERAGERQAVQQPAQARDDAGDKGLVERSARAAADAGSAPGEVVACEVSRELAVGVARVVPVPASDDLTRTAPAIPSRVLEEGEAVG